MAALFCAVVAALLTIRGVAAQHNTDDASLINVSSLAQLDAIRWDLDGNGEADNPDQHVAPDDDTSATQGNAYAAAFPSVTCPSDGCKGYELMNDLNFSGSRWASGDGWDPIGIYTSSGGSPYGSPFTAIFDGNGHSISNLYIDREEEDGVGLFGNFGGYGGSRTIEIRNLELRNVDVTGGEKVGGLVGYNGGGSISNSSVTGGSVTGDRQVGGLAGSSSGPIDNGSSAAAVSGKSKIGGLVGHSLDPIENSHASGDVSGEDDVGGLVGRNDDDITRSYATGDVTGTGTDGRSSVGGLVGTHWYDGSTISNSHAEGNVTGARFVGGLVGLAWGGDIQTSYATGDVTGETFTDSNGDRHWSGRIGGLVGSTRGATISTSFATGYVKGMHYVGGLVGENQGQTIRATYAHGDVEPTGMGTGDNCRADSQLSCRIGGLVAQNVNGGAIIASYSIGRLIVRSHDLRIGGLAGESPIERLHAFVGYVDPGTITASYWDTETSEMVVGVGTDDKNNNRVIDLRNLDVRPIQFGETTQDGVAGKTTSELQTPTGYTGIYETWDDNPDLDLDDDSSTGDANGKDAPWYFDTASDYPVLKIDVDLDGDVDQDDYDAQAPQQANRKPTVNIDSVTQPVAGGADVQLQATATDRDGSIASYKWTATGGAFSNSAVEDAIWTAPVGQSTEQTYTLTLTVTDNEGESTSADLEIMVRALNKLPTVTIETGPATVDGGAVVDLSATATDPDGSIASYLWTATPDVGTFANATSEDPTWTAPAKTDAEQPIEITLTVTDSDGGTQSATVIITVAANSQPTASITTQGRDVAEGEVISLQAEAADDDSNTLTYLWSADPNLGEFSDPEVLQPTWTAPAKTNAEQPIVLTLTVSDGTSTGAAEVTFTVLANVAPEVTIITGAQELAGGGEITLDATATDDDDDDNSLTYQWAADPDVGDFSATEALGPTWTAPDRTNAAQSIALTLTITDPGGLTGSDTVTITVDSNQSPTVSINTVFQLVDGGDEITLDATASDPDQDTLTYAWMATGGTFADAAIEDATWTAPETRNTAQAITLTLKATDTDGLSAIATVNFTVRANTAPTVTMDTGAQTVAGGADVQLITTVTDEETSSLTYSWRANGGAFSDDAIQQPTWTAPDAESVARSYTLTLIVTDNGNLTGSDAVTMTVNADPPPQDINHAPTVTIDTQATIVDGGATVNLQATVVDSDASDTHTYAWTGQGTFSDDEALEPTWTAPTRLSGAQAILLTLVVTDSGGLTATDTVTITVRANSLPRVDITSDFQQPVSGSEVVQLTATASDPDNDQLTYRWEADDGAFSDGGAILQPTWTAPDAESTEQAYTLTLTVTDSGGLEVGDAITIIVRANQSPTVEIDTASTTVEGSVTVNLAARANDPDDDDALTYRWSADPDRGSFSDSAALNPTWTAPPMANTAQPVNLTLEVSDPDGLKATDTVTITVRGSAPAPPPRPSTPDGGSPSPGPSTSDGGSPSPGPSTPGGGGASSARGSSASSTPGTPPAPAPPQLAVALTVEGEPVPVGQTVVFKVTITNNTDATLTGVVWRDVAFSGAPQSLGDLAAGASVTVTGSFGPVEEVHLPGIILTVAADSDQTDERPASRYVRLAAASEAPTPSEAPAPPAAQLALPSVPYATLSTLGLRVVRVQYTVPDIHVAHNIPDLMMTLGDGEQVGCEFLTYYEETGGLTRWGHAISEVLEERPGTLTQYYQRGAFDCHPKVGTQWEIERRLAWDYIGGGAGGSPDLGTEPGLLSEQPGNILWTWGHRVSNYAIDGTEVGFLNFFDALGGIESFGYPKTDARVDNHPLAVLNLPNTDTAVIRQYFQAAVLEYHPNDALQPVKPALLGDLLRDRRYPYQSYLAFASFGTSFPLRVGQVYKPEKAVFPEDFIPPGLGT